ncbi:hypothetical protein ACFQ1E_00520 [Sphingomonas canadensis]|uniref:Uncharacterized protein n=1 Tax=Sphingomonas canadensis TaxID=1219257 RepID=A0ABW3H032_9SPHN|nr:hypothetical protein [Sphingomonas canadensis]MCW3835277.1 hypothetical protein [Sphingomonas canadensis]
MKRRLSIQHCHIHWDKAARGMPWSGVRNALPRELPFRAPFDSDPGWYHRIDYRGRNRFEPEEAMREIAKTEGSRVPVTTRIDGDFLALRFDVGARTPYRPHLEGFIARLPFGQRLTYRINCKADGDHDRWYFEDVFHIGWAAESTLDLPLFRDIDERVLLY